MIMPAQAHTRESVAAALAMDLAAEPSFEADFDAQAKAEGVVEAYNKSHLDLSDAQCMMRSDFMFAMPHHRLLAASAGGTGRHFAYQFAWKSPISGLGACHALELPFVFGSVRNPALQAFAGSGPAALSLSSMMMEAWGKFAATGDPGWEQWTAESRATLVFGAGQKAQAHIRPLPLEHEIAAWAGVKEQPRLKLQGEVSSVPGKTAAHRGLVQALLSDPEWADQPM
jgi:carboxylesterase type B